LNWFGLTVLLSNGIFMISANVARAMATVLSTKGLSPPIVAHVSELLCGQAEIVAIFSLSA
jgi:hypothetical protein